MSDRYSTRMYDERSSRRIISSDPLVSRSPVHSQYRAERPQQGRSPRGGEADAAMHTRQWLSSPSQQHSPQSTHHGYQGPQYNRTQSSSHMPYDSAKALWSFPGDVCHPLQTLPTSRTSPVISAPVRGDWDVPCRGFSSYKQPPQIHVRQQADIVHPYDFYSTGAPQYEIEAVASPGPVEDPVKPTQPAQKTVELTQVTMDPSMDLKITTPNRSIQIRLRDRQLHRRDHRALGFADANVSVPRCSITLGFDCKSIHFSFGEGRLSPNISPDADDNEGAAFDSCSNPPSDFFPNAENCDMRESTFNGIGRDQTNYCGSIFLRTASGDDDDECVLCNTVINLSPGFDQSRAQNS